MIKTFPSTKWVKTATSTEQMSKVIEEIMEVTEHIKVAKDNKGKIKVTRIINPKELDKEAADLMHALQGYFEIRERDGLDVDKFFETETIEKNRARNYYPVEKQYCNNILGNPKCPNKYGRYGCDIEPNKVCNFYKKEAK